MGHRPRGWRIARALQMRVHQLAVDRRPSGGLASAERGASRRPTGERRRLHSAAMTSDVAPAVGRLDLDANPTRPRIFSGIQPSGLVHLGNDLGAIRNYVALAEQYEAIYCIV